MKNYVLQLVKGAMYALILLVTVLGQESSLRQATADRYFQS